MVINEIYGGGKEVSSAPRQTGLSELGRREARRGPRHAGTHARPGKMQNAFIDRRCTGDRSPALPDLAKWQEAQRYTEGVVHEDCPNMPLLRSLMLLVLGFYRDVAPTALGDGHLEED
jgi:hypothetical protein